MANSMGLRGKTYQCVVYEDDPHVVTPEEYEWMKVKEPQVRRELTQAERDAMTRLMASLWYESGPVDDWRSR